LTGEKSTTVSALSEGIFWDFKNKSLSEAIFNYFGFDKSIIPPIQPVCSIHGKIKQAVAEKLSLPTNVQVTYKAGDQLNNALSLNVLQPGEVAATAGTSGVIYGVTDQLAFDKDSRINSFAHINHTDETNRLGILLCINGAGILNKWIKQTTSDTITYDTMNELASQVPIGSEGLSIFPFGNGAERILNNKMVDAHINGLQFNVHNNAHLYRAAQEGICFAFKYGLNIMKENSMHPTVIKAGRANLFLSDVFVNSFVNTTGIPVEIYNNDGSVGAAIGAAIGFGAYENEREAFANMEPLRIVYPDNTKLYTDLYSRWLEKLHTILK
jgi:xylulokinase